MLDKLKIAAVLLVIGAISGISIWGVNELTEPVIERNQAAAEAEMYRELFPDLSEVEIEEYDHNLLSQMIIVYGDNGSEIGRIFRGTTTNNFGEVTALIGIASDSTIARVIISDHTNTPNYANIIINDYLHRFDGQDITNISYDANTGASATYGAVRRLIEAAVIEVAGDVRLEAYETMFTDAASYESDTVTLDGVDELYNVYDSSDNALGVVYEITAANEGVYIAFDTDGALVAVKTQDNLEDVTAFDAYLGLTAEEISLDVSGDLEESIAETLQTILDSMSGVTAIDGEYLVSYKPYSVDGEIVGYLFEGRAEGFSGENIITVAIDFAGEIIDVVLVNYSDTPDYVESSVLPNLEDLVGLTSLDGLSADDTFSGASSTGGSIFDVVTEAFTYFGDNLSDSTPIDDDVLTKRETLYNESDEAIGYTYYGVGTGLNGDVEVMVAIDNDGAIISVELGEHGETEDYVNNYILDNLSHFEGLTEAEGESSDTFAGATNTGNAIYTVVESALSYHADGPSEPTDPDEDEVDLIDINGTTLFGVVENMEDDVLVSKTYYGVSEGRNGDVEVLVTVDLEGTIINVELGEHGETDYYVDEYILENLDTFNNLSEYDTVLDDTFAGATVTGNAILTVVKEVLATTYVDEGVIDRYVHIYDESNNHIETQYAAITEGRNGDVEVLVTLDLDNTIVSVELGDHSETGYYVDEYILDNLSVFTGENETISVDTFAGATVTGEAIVEAVQAVIDYTRTTFVEGQTVTKVVEVYESGTLSAHRYHSVVEGRNGDVEVLVTLDLDNTIVSVELGNHSETGYYVDEYILDNLSVFTGESETISVDTFAGATVTGEAIVEAVQAVFDYLNTVVLEDTVLTHYIMDYTGGNLSGYTYYGEASGRNGNVEVIVSIDLTSTIVSVELGEHDETDYYVNEYIQGSLSDLVGLTSTDSLEANDAFTGATVTGEAIVTVVEAVLVHERDGE